MAVAMGSGASRDVAEDAVPLTWWTVVPNFGDLLSPYLVERLARKSVRLVEIKPGRSRKLERLGLMRPAASTLAIGSIISRATARSVVWGSGAFGTETRKDLNPHATYRAVRGPLTRNLLRMHGIECPAVYGDPALLMPRVFRPAAVEKRYKIGIVLRWAENDWNDRRVSGDICKIHLGTGDIETVICQMLSCERILSSSLHGLVLADAYGIPSAWLSSSTPKGLEFKFYDYFLSVNRVRPAQSIDLSGSREVTCEYLESKLVFTDGTIDFDPVPLLAACPFINTSHATESCEPAAVSV